MRLSAATTPPDTLLQPYWPLDTGIVHLGLGNFHRAHQAVHTAEAIAIEGGSPWGILGVASRSSTVVDALRAQDMRYSVLTVSPEGTRVSVPAVHTGALVAADDPDEVVDTIGSRLTAMVTLTVTEKGYHFSRRAAGLDLDDPAVRADLRGDAPPLTPVGIVARGLQRRARTHGVPLTVLSCDNLASNGDQTAQLMREFAAALPAAEAGPLLQFLEIVTFPNSMVDRIVPATTDADRATAARLLGVHDAVPVPAEPFTMWVMQDRFVAGRPPWHRTGAVFTDDVEPYELLKLRLLNGTHSLIAYLGALAGAATIPEAIDKEFVADAAQRAINDYLPTVEVPADVDLDAYVGALFTRWANTALGHRTHQVGSDGSGKLRQRIPDPAVQRLATGHLPHQLALTVAAWLSCIAPPSGFDPGPHAAAMVDPAREQLADARARTGSTAAFVEAVLDGGLLGSELAAHPTFAARVAELADVITRSGPAAAAAEAASAWSAT